MFKVLLPAVAALGLIAVVAHSQGAVAADGEDAPNPVMTWSVHHEGALAKLAYGVPHSDQLALMVSCQPGDRTAVVYGDVRPDTAQPVRTSAGPAPLDPLSGGEAEETTIAVGDPILRGLASRGRMDVRGDAGVFEITADRDERRIVGDFLAYCSMGRA